MRQVMRDALRGMREKDNIVKGGKKGKKRSITRG